MSDWTEEMPFPTACAAWVNRSLLVRNRLLLSGLPLLSGLLLGGSLFVGIGYRLNLRNVGIECSSGARNQIHRLNCSVALRNLDLQLA